MISGLERGPAFGRIRDAKRRRVATNDVGAATTAASPGKKKN